MESQLSAAAGPTIETHIQALILVDQHVNFFFVRTKGRYMTTVSSIFAGRQGCDRKLVRCRPS